MRTILSSLLFILLTFNGLGQEFKTLQQEIKDLEYQLKKEPRNTRVLFKLTDAYNLNSQYFRGLDVLKKFESTLKKSDKQSFAPLYLAYAKNYKYQGSVDKATLFFLKSKEAYYSLKDFNGFVKCGIEIIEFERKIGQYKEAEDHFHYYVSLAKRKKISDSTIWICLYNRYAAILNETNRLQESLAYSRKAMEIAKKSNNLDAIAISSNEMGFTYRNLANNDPKYNSESVFYYQQAVDSWMKMGYYRDAFFARMNKLTVEIHHELTPKASQLLELEKMLKDIDSLHIDFPKSRVYEEIRTHYIIIGDFEKAIAVDGYFDSFRMQEAEKKASIEMDNINAKYKNDVLLKDKVQNEKALKNAEFRIIMIVLILIIVILAFIALYILWNRLKISNNLLVKRNQQKSMLVQEIHHRVKNNLQFVRSMLEMQTNSMETIEGVENLDDVTRRIDAMSLVHEMLYIEEDGMGISIKKYLEQLIYLTSTMYNETNPIHFKAAIEDIELPVDKIVPIGVICSELFVNSVKHAFHNNETPIIEVSLEQVSQKSFILTVADNGLEADLSEENKRYNLGMRLIDIFSRQLNGTYKINKSNGYEFKLKFKI